MTAPDRCAVPSRSGSARHPPPRRPREPPRPGQRGSRLSAPPARSAVPASLGAAPSPGTAQRPRRPNAASRPHSSRGPFPIKRSSAEPRSPACRTEEGKEGGKRGVSPPAEPGARARGTHALPGALEEAARAEELAARGVPAVQEQQQDEHRHDEHGRGHRCQRRGDAVSGG